MIQITDNLKREFQNTDELLDWALSLTGEEIITLSHLGYAKQKRLYDYAVGLAEKQGLTRKVLTCKMELSPTGEIKNFSGLRKDKEMSFKTLPKFSENETVKLENYGDSLDGTLLAIRTVKTGNGEGVVADFTRTDDGQKVSMFLTTQLQYRITSDMEGLRLLITYTGDVQGKKGGRPYKDYDIAVWSEDNEDDDIPF